MNSRKFTATVQSKCAELKCRVTTGLIQNAEQADEAAAELAGENSFDQNSKEFETLLAILYAEAGKLFSGSWEDYPKAKSRF